MNKMTHNILSRVVKSLGKISSDRTKRMPKDIIKADIEFKENKFSSPNDKVMICLNETMSNLDNEVYSFSEWLSVNSMYAYFCCVSDVKYNPWNLVGFVNKIKSKMQTIHDIEHDKQIFLSILKDSKNTIVQNNAERPFVNSYFLKPYKEYKSFLFLLVDKGIIGYGFFAWYIRSIEMENPYKNIYNVCSIEYKFYRYAHLMEY